MVFYSVHKGRICGIYNDWKTCQSQINGFSGAKYKKCKDLKSAEFFLKNGEIDNTLNTNNNTINNTNNNNTIINHYHFKSDILKVYTDGSLIRKNGLVGSGYGIYIPYPDNIKISKILKEPKTNNRAELSAIIWTSKYCINNNIKNIEIYTDSKYCIYICNGTGKKYHNSNYIKNGITIPNKDLIITLLPLLNKINIKFTHILAHTKNQDINSIGNDIADKLALSASKLDIQNNL